MKILEITAAERMGGRIVVPGAKNSALALLAGACLSDAPVQIRNVPDISDVGIVLQIIRDMGGSARREGHTVTVDGGGIRTPEILPEEAGKIRTAYYFVGALLARFGKVSVGYAGGDDFTERPIDQHFKGLRALGASIILYKDHYVVQAGRLKGAEIQFDTITMGATINLMMAAVLAEGRTVLRNAARDPEVVDLAVMLNEMGAGIIGAGTETIRIEGVMRLGTASHSVIPDRLVAAAFITALGTTGGRLVLDRAVPEHLANLIGKYREIGYDFTTSPDKQNLIAETDGCILPTRVRAGMYPLFSTDYQQPLAALLLKAHGTSVVSDRVYPMRFNQCAEFIRMGASLRTRTGSVRIQGGRPLHGTHVHATDIRAGTALLIAGLLADGTTFLSGVEHLDRGFEDAAAMFSRIGAPVRMVEMDASYAMPRREQDG